MDHRLPSKPHPAASRASTESAAERALRPVSGLDSFPYRNRVREVMSAPPLMIGAQDSIRDALGILISKGVSSVFVRDASGELGIVTERDILRAVDAGGSDALGKAVGSIATKPLYSVSADAFVYRAIARLERLGFRHLGVRDAQGNIIGALTTRNLLRHRAAAALTLGDEIDSAPDAAALAQARLRLPHAARLLLEDGVDARTIAAIISSEICLMTRRAAQLAEAAMIAAGRGKAPVRYAVLVLGSGGRGESLLSADQDNAIVFEHGEAGGAEDLWFQEMATHMAEILDRAGIPFCKGGVMAKNAAWRHSVAGWKEVIGGWVRRQRTADLLNVDIFYDALTVHGDASLGEEIWQYAYEAGHKAPDFQNLLIENARDRRPPFTVFGMLRLDGDRRVDIKLGGLLPIFGAARVLSIRHDARVRATPDRLRAAIGKGAAASDVEQVIEAHGELLAQMLAQQLDDQAHGLPLSPCVAIDRLRRQERARLKQALRAVDTALAIVSEGRH
jgi:DNA polymerase-3 subunit epsilon/CBS domain-containing protein